MALPPCPPVLWGTRGRCTEASTADGAGDRSDRSLIPRLLSLAEGDLAQLHGDASSRKAGTALSDGNCIYDTI